MDHHIKEFYSQYSDETPRGNFHKVISLNQETDLDWEIVKQKVPDLCKGWYELAHLQLKDRIDFTREYWLAKLPYHPPMESFLERFFNSLDDIAVFLVQNKFDDPFEAHLVYSMKGDSGFFSGHSPAKEEELTKLQNNFPGYLLPNDYLAFLQIHNGFCKTTDSTGIIKSNRVHDAYLTLHNLIQEKGKDRLTTSKGVVVEEPRSLIPFYESFGMPFYQCFWGEWYPESEMGNVYFSGEAFTISDTTGESGPETLAFPSFTDWLIFYLEKVV